MLIAAPAFLMIRLLEPELVLPAFSMLLFTEAAIAAIVARRKCGECGECNVVGYCRRIHHDGLRRRDLQRTGSSGTIFRATSRTT